MRKKERARKQSYWDNELNSLGIQPKRKNDLNDEEELAALADNIKQVYYQNYKTAYADDKDIKEDDSRFDFII